ncbi:helix-turn-helix transcriptional regulator [Sinorhizobium meliloti]|uniref:helix-turn-helix transcriptional regulator n=1 Tax=Rhizobium meliloti TaxID=382 RepID=UPI0039996B35
MSLTTQFWSRVPSELSFPLFPQGGKDRCAPAQFLPALAGPHERGPMSQSANEALLAFVRDLARRQARIDIELEAQRRSDPGSLQPEAPPMDELPASSRSFQLRGDRLLKLREVMSMTSLGSSTIYRRMKAGKFPKPKRLSEACVTWRESEIQKWMCELPTNGGVSK